MHESKRVNIWTLNDRVLDDVAYDIDSEAIALPLFMDEVDIFQRTITGAVVVHSAGGTVNGWRTSDMVGKAGNPNLLMGRILSIITCNNEANELRSSSVQFTALHLHTHYILKLYSHSVSQQNGLLRWNRIFTLHFPSRACHFRIISIVYFLLKRDQFCFIMHLV